MLLKVAAEMVHTGTCVRVQFPICFLSRIIPFASTGRIRLHRYYLLGIPVRWSQISGAKTIIECEMTDISVDPSQGTHFFQNIVSFNVGYLTIRNNDPGKIDWKWLESLTPEMEEGPIRHIKLEHPLRILLDGRKGNAAILKPKT